MKMRTLAHEMRAAFAALETRDVEQLVGLGVPELLVSHFQMVGIARVREDSSRTLYDPDPGGPLAYITRVLVQFAETPESTRPDAAPLIGNPVDLVAWDEKTPEQWRLRVGSATWLGCIPPQYMEPEPVRIWRSPLNWLRGRCAGLVPLAPERGEVYRLLANCTGELVAEDAEHAAALQDILEHPWPASRVLYQTGMTRRAA